MLLPGQNGLESADLEVRICEKLDIHRQPIVLPQHHPTTLACAGEVAENRKCELSERRTRLDHAHKERYYARLRGLLLPTLVQTTEVVTRLEYMI
jgi:hypothetical protein